MVSLLICLGATFSWADDWPQWLGPRRDSVWRETGVLEQFPAAGPSVLWRAPVGPGYSGPVVAKGRVYVTDRQLASDVTKPADPFQRGSLGGVERVLCMNEADGKLLWHYEYDCAYTVSYAAGPRVAPLVNGGRVYSLGAEGNLLCLDARDGRPIWSKDLKADYHVKAPLWGFAAHPLLLENRLFCLVGGDGSTVVALDKDTGKELWRALNASEPGYSSPMLFQTGGKPQLIIFEPEAVHSLDPRTGQVFWSIPFKSNSGLSVATPRAAGANLFFTCFYNGSLMLQTEPAAAAPTTLWRTQKASEKDTTHLNAIFCTPFLEDGFIYGVCSYGQLRCLNAATGARVWETFKATTDGQPVRWANAFIVKNGRRFFLFNEKGDLIIANLTPAGYEEISRAHILEPTNKDCGRLVVWSHPAFANRRFFARNDKELVCVDLSRK